MSRVIVKSTGKHFDRFHFLNKTKLCYIVINDSFKCIYL